MQKDESGKYRSYCFFLILFSVHLTGIGQMTKPVNGQEKDQRSLNYNETVRSYKVGQSLSSTGICQFPPWVVNVSAVAPDVLCLEVDACRILPAVQIPYKKDPSDVVTESGVTGLGETRNMFVVRNGFPLGTLVGPDLKKKPLYEIGREHV